MRTSFVTTVAVTMVMTTAPMVAVQADPTGVVAYRQAAMKTFGTHLNAIKALIQEEPALIDQAAIHAQSMADLAVVIPAMFPEGSEDPESDALPSVWEDPEGFEAASDVLVERSETLVEAVDGGDVATITQAFAALGREGCGGCHNDYRVKN